LSDKVSEENSGVHDEEAEDEDVVNESENAESHFRNDVERTQDVQEGEPGQQDDPDPEDQVDPVRGPDHGPKRQKNLDLDTYINETNCFLKKNRLGSTEVFYFTDLHKNRSASFTH
jgi:hypothetical protein